MDNSPSRGKLVRALLLSTFLHGLVGFWVGMRLFERSDLASVTIYEIEVLPEEPSVLQPPQVPIPTITPPAVARAEEIPLPDEATVEEPAPGPAPTAPQPGSVRRPVGAPAAAKAGRVITAPEAAGGEADPLDFTIVQGKADRYAGGVTAATGTSDQAVRDPKAQGGAEPVRRPGGTGTGAGTPPPAKRQAPKPVSKRRAARPVSVSWNCPFPSEADAQDVHYARVMIVVSVRKNGTAAKAALLSDPGYGFGAAARSCALGQRYSVAWDDSGRPTAGRTPPFTVTFTR